SRMFAGRNLRPSPQGWFPASHARNREKTPMNDQFPPPSWFMRPETWPYWMPNSLLGARTPPTPPGDTWDAPWPATSRGGILGSLTRPPEGRWANQWAVMARGPRRPTNRRAFWSPLPEVIRVRTARPCGIRLSQEVLGFLGRPARRLR